MAGFTPGPWQAVLSHEKQPQILYRGLICVLERSPDQWTSVVAKSSEASADRASIDANARLIAAAPELYEATTRTLNSLRAVRDTMPAEWDALVGNKGSSESIFAAIDLLDAWDAMKAALDKAEGR